MKKGFTLAEVLITLGVIGVVAALTLPNLLQNHQKKVFVTQLQRAVNLISNSATQLVSDENAPSLDDTYLVAVNNDYKNAQGKFMNKYFKVARDCGTDNRAACLGEIYYSLDRTATTNLANVLNDSGWAGPYYCVTVNTGATICMTTMSKDWEHNFSQVVLDVNGPAGPNTSGRDLFDFYLYSDGKIANSYDVNNPHYEYQSSGERCQDLKDIAYGGSCFQHLQANGWVMDY